MSPHAIQARCTGFGWTRTAGGYPAAGMRRHAAIHVQRLRNKLGDHADWVETVRGFGYRFRTDPPQ